MLFLEKRNMSATELSESTLRVVHGRATTIKAEYNPDIDSGLPGKYFSDQVCYYECPGKKISGGQG